MPDNAIPEHERRRAVIKGVVGATAGALVWTEPTIRGLARRPAYANVASLNPDGNCEIAGGTTITLTNGCGTAGGVEFCAVKLTGQGGNVFQVQLSGGCTFVGSGQITITDNQGDAATVNVPGPTPGVSDPTVKNEINGQAATTLLVLGAGVTINCP